MADGSNLAMAIIDGPCFEDKEFTESVSLVKHALKDYLANDVSKKETGLLFLLKFLLKKSSFGRFPTFTEAWLQPMMKEEIMGSGEIIKYLNLDICVALISDYSCEEIFMNLLLEQKLFGLIERLFDSLSRWKRVDKSGLFMIKCLQVLLDSQDISFERLYEVQMQLLSKIDVILPNLNYEQSQFFLSNVKLLYARRLVKHFSETKPLNLSSASQPDSMSFLKSALEISRSGFGSFLKAQGDETAKALQKEISIRVQIMSVLQKNDSLKLLEAVCGENRQSATNSCSEAELIKIIEIGVLFICTQEEKNGKTCNKLCSDLPCGDKLWLQLLDIFKSENIDCSNLGSLISQSYELQEKLKCQLFLELVEGWDSCTLNIVEKYPEITKLYAPIICSAKFLKNMFHELANMHSKALGDVKKQAHFDQLLSLAHEISIKADISINEEVLSSCLGFFNGEKLSFFNEEKRNIRNELELILNQLSQNDSCSFNDLAFLCLLSPFDVLKEILTRGSTSAPLSNLFLNFLNQMSSLLLLQRTGSQQKEIISLINNSLRMMPPKKYQVIIDFVGGIMAIKRPHCTEAAVKPSEILLHVLTPALREHLLIPQQGVPLRLLLPLLKSVLDVTTLEMNYQTEMLELILNSVFCMLKILEQFKVENDIGYFIKSIKKREQLHSTVRNCLSKIQSTCLGHGTNERLTQMIISRLHDVQWQSKFYFVDLLSNEPEFLFPVPSQIMKFTNGFKTLKLCAFNGLYSNLDSQLQLWIVIIRICEINEEFACHLIGNVFKVSAPNISDITTAISTSLIESTIQGWQSVVSMVRTVVVVANHGMFNTLGLSGFNNLQTQNFAIVKSIIVQSILIAFNSFFNMHNGVGLNAVKKLEVMFLDDIQTLKECNQIEAVDCLAVLYHYAMYLKKVNSNYNQIFDSLILQILEAVSKKEILKGDIDEFDIWNERLCNFKKYIAE